MKPDSGAWGEASIRRLEAGAFQEREDRLAREEPLEIRVLAPEDGLPEGHRIAVTMRTPGRDADLAAGFLFSEGLIREPGQIARIHPATTTSSDAFGNILNVELSPGVPFDPPSLARHVFTASSCGLCGKASLELVRTVCPHPPRGDTPLSSQTLLELPTRLAGSQPLFRATGGIHAAALFTPAGELVHASEDVGRHNAVDKLVGSLLLAGKLPAHDTVLLVSGRASFELVQKAAMAGIPTLAAVGAPSTLAVDLAREFNMTLVGFLRETGFNTYAGHGRVDAQT